MCVWYSVRKGTNCFSVFKIDTLFSINGNISLFLFDLSSQKCPWLHESILDFLFCSPLFIVCPTLIPGPHITAPLISLDSHLKSRNTSLSFVLPDCLEYFSPLNFQKYFRISFSSYTPAPSPQYLSRSFLRLHWLCRSIWENESLHFSESGLSLHLFRFKNFFFS